MISWQSDHRKIILSTKADFGLGFFLLFCCKAHSQEIVKTKLYLSSLPGVLEEY